MLAKPFLYKDWQRAQNCAAKLGDRSVKITLPGPMTIGDTTADDYYENPQKRGAAIAAALNSEVLSLAKAGCQTHSD